MELLDALFTVAGLRALPPPMFWLLWVGLVVGAGVSFVFLWRQLRRKRLIEDTPTSKIRSAAQGYIELNGWGRHLPHHVTHGPLTALPCLWYRFKVEKFERSATADSHDKGAWKVIKQGTSDQNFVLDDESGTCILDPAGAEVTPSLKDVWEGDTPNPLAARKSREAGLAATILATGARYRYTEERLIENDLLYVLGYHESIGGGRISFDHDGAVRDVIAEWKQDYQAMIDRFDADGDGRIDLQEWDQVRTAARQEADRQKVEEDTSTTLHLVVRPPDRTKPYIISSRTEEDLVAALHRHTWAALAGFLLLGSYAAFMLSARVAG